MRGVSRKRGLSVLLFSGAVLGCAVTAWAADNVPSPWDGRDIGPVGEAGDASNTSGTTAGPWTIAGSGADIWGTTDAFHYVSRQIDQTSNSTETLIARITSEQNTDPFAKAGLMIRDSYSASGAEVIVDVNPNGNIEFMTRPQDGAATTYIAGAVESFPAWLRLDYQAPTATAYVSTVTRAAGG